MGRSFLARWLRPAPSPPADASRPAPRSWREKDARRQAIAARIKGLYDKASVALTALEDKVVVPSRAERARMRAAVGRIQQAVETLEAEFHASVADGDFGPEQPSTWRSATRGQRDFVAPLKRRIRMLQTTWDLSHDEFSHPASSAAPDVLGTRPPGLDPVASDAAFCGARFQLRQLLAAARADYSALGRGDVDRVALYRRLQKHYTALPRAELALSAAAKRLGADGPLASPATWPALGAAFDSVESLRSLLKELDTRLGDAFTASERAALDLLP